MLWFKIIYTSSIWILMRPPPSFSSTCKTIDCDDLTPLPDDKNLEWSKLEQIADDILKCI